MKRALVIALALAGTMAASVGSAMAADIPGVKDNSHSICVVFSQNQKYNDVWYYCVSTPDLPPAS